jgi:hypothetical protein
MQDSVKEVIIGVAYDGFDLRYGDFMVWIDQEDDPSKGLKKFFNHIGFNVIVLEDY